MKKFFTTALLALVVTASALAGNTAENAKVNRVFKAEYPEAEHISYKSGKDYVVINFVQHQQQMQAFYDNDGNKIGTSRAISLNSLPLPAQKKLAEKYKDYTTTEAIEFDNVQEGIGYYVSLQNSAQKIILHISSQGEISTFRKSSL